MAEETSELKGSHIDHTVRRVYPGQCKVCGRTRCRGHKVKVDTRRKVGGSYQQRFPDDPYVERFPSVQPHLAAMFAHRVAKRGAGQDIGVPEQLTRGLRTQAQRESAKTYERKQHG